MVGSSKADQILRAKYLDWCSARIAERFLALSPDELYERAQQASLGAANQATPQATLSPPTGTLRAMIALVTDVLADEMVLPTFEEWSAAYSEAPEEFDRDLLGFWKEGL